MRIAKHNVIIPHFNPLGQNKNWALLCIAKSAQSSLPPNIVRAVFRTSQYCSSEPATLFGGRVENLCGLLDFALISQSLRPLEEYYTLLILLPLAVLVVEV
jgi:hypothetical protein